MQVSYFELITLLPLSAMHRQSPNVFHMTALFKANLQLKEEKKITIAKQIKNDPVGYSVVKGKYPSRQNIYN